MGSKPPVTLILGHSFVRRLRYDLETIFDQRANQNFNLEGTASVSMHGVGGRMVPNLRMYCLIFILEMWTNDLSFVVPEVVGSAIDDLVRFLLDKFAVRIVGILCVASEPLFLTSATALSQYTGAVLDGLPNVSFLPGKDIYFPWPIPIAS